MTAPNSAVVDTAKARELWAECQRRHDVSDRTGQAVGVDPVTGRIWFGRKALDIAHQMRTEGIDRPFYCVRVGKDTQAEPQVVIFQEVIVEKYFANRVTNLAKWQSSLTTDHTKDAN